MKSQNNNPIQWMKTSLRGAVAITLTLGLFVACSMSADEASDLSGAFNNAPQSNAVYLHREAQNSLFEHDVIGANSTYSQILADYPEDGTAAAGKAITDVLLVPYSIEFTDLITGYLGAARALNATKDVLYAEGGLLYLLSRGVPFEDGDSFPGIRTLLVDDLPWSTRQLGSFESMVDGLNKPVSGMFDALGKFADSLQPIERNLDAALQDESFESIFIPGEVFHHTDLSLVITHTELAAIRAVLSGVRAVTYFGSAYSWEFSLDEAFGAHWSELEVGAEGHVEGYLYEDYVISFLDSRVFRALRRPENLSLAEASFKNLLRYTWTAIELGLKGEVSGELQFGDADQRTVAEFGELVVAIENAPDGPVTVPHTVPEVTMDLSSFFNDGRVLDSELRWMELTVESDEFGEYRSWDFTDDAFVRFFVEGVFTPTFDSKNVPEVQFSGDGAAASGAVTGPLFEDVEDAYLSGR